ncbi:MAG: hypothetical protein Q8R76_08510 [Candidatus Omnitrophota bacterium]|nr:hypothetical protein [Candidatus Omnitrophota bacterium]
MMPPTTARTRIILTALLVILIVTSGVHYQYRYDQRRIAYREVITGYYRQYFNREPDAKGLKHWTTWALNKWGLEKVERLGFINAKKKGFH